MRELFDEVLATQLERIQLQLARQSVDRPLEHVGRLGPTCAAIRVGRRRVREDARERDAVVRDLVRARVDPGAEERNPGRDELEVGAHRRLHIGLDAGDRAVLRRGQRELGGDVATVDGGDVVLGTLLDPLHRAAEPARQRHRERFLRVHVQLRAEASADVGSDHADLRLGDAEHELEREAQDVRHLRRRPERDVAGRAHLREHATRLDRVRDQPRLVIAARDDDLGGGQRLLGAVACELPDVALVRAEVVVHERRVALQRLRHVDRRIERLVLDLDELRGVLRERAALGDDDRDAVALVARHVGREGKVRRHLDVLGHRPGAGEGSLPVGRELRAAERRDDAVRGARGVDVHGGEARVRVWAPDHRHRDDAGKRQVVDEGRAAGEKRLVLSPLDRGAEVAPGARVDGAHVTPSRPRPRRRGRCCGSRCSGRGCPRGPRGSRPRCPPRRAR